MDKVTPPLDQTLQRPRRRVVEDVVQLMVEGMQIGAPYATGAELMCACLTLTLRTIEASVKASPTSRTSIRHGVDVLYLACADEDVVN